MSAGRLEALDVFSGGVPHAPRGSRLSMAKALIQLRRKQPGAKRPISSTINFQDGNRGLTIRAARFGPEADTLFQGKRGSFKGATRVTLDFLTFPFNELVLSRIPRKSLKFL
jgi:hypothetical protein